MDVCYLQLDLETLNINKDANAVCLLLSLTWSYRSSLVLGELAERRHIFTVQTKKTNLNFMNN